MAFPIIAQEFLDIGHKMYIISGIPMCDECFNKLTLLRNDDTSAIIFFNDENNMSHASKDYINSILQNKPISKEEQQRQEKLKQAELDKINYAKSFKEYYEYDVVTIENKNSGEVKTYFS